ncbi:MAG: hypothetical protein NUV35_06030, partial [Syntrophomonadaceae bacterium]|nr:hypothetical protein [Syntrophomonadaceae bacterium]
HTCDLGMPIEPSWMKLRGLLVDGMGFHTFPPFEIMVNTSRRQGNIWGGYRRDRAQWLTDEFRPDIVERSDYAFFVGCTSSYVEHDLARSAAFCSRKAA